VNSQQFSAGSKPTNNLGLITTLSKYIECSREKYNACLDCIETDLAVDGVQVTLRYHHLRFDGNGQPKFQDLAKCLADHLVEYCLSARRRDNPRQAHEFGKLHREARGLLRKFDTSGESGELLLYFLMESVLGAPQIVAKMDLKTNHKLEVFGSDGIHMKWNAEDNCLDLYFGEAKLEQTVSSALDNAFASIEKFHAEGAMDLEFGLVTSHFKWADDKVRAAVVDYVDRQKPGSDCRINHACLIGYNWEEYMNLGTLRLDALEKEFKLRYKDHAPHLQQMLSTRFDKCSRKHLRFEMFFLPFRTVQEFRDAFIKAVS
jgi:hypothetical protein